MSNRPGRAIKRQQMRARPAKPATKPLPIRWLVLGGLAAVGAIMLIVALAVGDSESSATDQTGFAEIMGTPLAPYEKQPPELDPAVGEPAPAISGTDFAGDPVFVDPGDGTGKVLVFFAHWCSHCQAELPRLVSWLDASPATGVDVIGISTAVDQGAPNYPPSDWFEREGWTLPIIRDTSDFALDTAFGSGGFPRFVVIGGDGLVKVRTSGEIPQTVWDQLLELARSG